MRLARRVVPLLLGLLAAACQTTGSGGGTYHFFFSPADHVSQLLAQGEIDHANQVWSQQSAFFVASTNSDAVKATGALSEALSLRLSPRIERERARLDAIDWPVPRSRWPEVKAELSLAEAMKTELDGQKVLVAAGDARRARFFQAYETKTAPIRADAPAHFTAEEPNFFEAYPVPLDRRVVLSAAHERWAATLATASRADLLAFYGRHREALDDTGLVELARLHFRAALSGRGGGAEHVVAALDETRGAGLPTGRIERAGVRFVQLTDRDRPGAFRIQVDAAPFSADVATLDRLADDAATARADILVVIDARATSVDRVISSREGVPSEYRSGTRERRNPDYERAKDELTAARFRLREVRRAFERQLERCRVDCANPALLRHSGVLAAEVDYEFARNTLDATPETISIPTYSAYRFEKLTVAVEKTGSFAYYVIDRRARTLRKGTEFLTARERFVVAEGLHEADRDRSRFAGMHTEADIANNLQRSETVSIVPIFERVPTLAARLLPSMAELRREMEADRAGARAALSAAARAAR